MYNADKLKPHKILWLSAKEALFVFPFHNSNVWGARFLSTFTSHYLIKAHHPPFHFIFKRHFYSFASRPHITLEAVLYLSSDRVGGTCKYRVDTFPFMGTKAARWWILRWIETYSLCSYMTLAHTSPGFSLHNDSPNAANCLWNKDFFFTLSLSCFVILKPSMRVKCSRIHARNKHLLDTTFFHKWPLLESVFFVSKYRKWYLYTFNSW